MEQQNNKKDVNVTASETLVMLRKVMCLKACPSIRAKSIH